MILWCIGDGTSKWTTGYQAIRNNIPVKDCSCQCHRDETLDFMMPELLQSSLDAKKIAIKTLPIKSSHIDLTHLSSKKGLEFAKKNRFDLQKSIF